MKIKYGIASWKVTKFVTTIQNINMKQTENRANKFILQVEDKLLTFNSGQILNANQSGFKYCIVNVRLLSIKGEKRTVYLTKSDFSKTRSYTIMLTLSISR